MTERLSCFFSNHHHERRSLRTCGIETHWHAQVPQRGSQGRHMPRSVASRSSTSPWLRCSQGDIQCSRNQKNGPVHLTHYTTVSVIPVLMHHIKPRPPSNIPQLSGHRTSPSRKRAPSITCGCRVLDCWGGRSRSPAILVARPDLVPTRLWR